MLEALAAGPHLDGERLDFTTTTTITEGATTMATTTTTTYADTYAALNRAVQRRAVSVTIDTDMGEVTLPPAEALAVFDDIAPGEGFTLVSTTFATTTTTGGKKMKTPEQADRAQRAEKMSAQRLVDELVHAAKGVAYWEGRGTHGDGKLERAKEELKNKRRDVTREINRLRGGYAS